MPSGRAARGWRASRSTMPTRPRSRGGPRRRWRATDGRLFAVFNNGAFACPGAVEDLPRGALEEIFATNLFGVHDLSVRLIPAMRATGGGADPELLVGAGLCRGAVAGRLRGHQVRAGGAERHAAAGDAGDRLDVVLIEPGPDRDAPARELGAAFRRWVDWERSARAEQYRAPCCGGSTRGRPTASSARPRRWPRPSWRALTDTPPRARYRVTLPTRLALIARMLPAGLQDRLLRRA